MFADAHPFKMAHISASATVKFVSTFKIYSHFCIATLRPPQRATAPEPHGGGTIKSIWPSRRDLYFIVFFRSLYLQISCDCGFCESGNICGQNGIVGLCSCVVDSLSVWVRQEYLCVFKHGLSIALAYQFLLLFCTCLYRSFAFR